LAGTKALCPRTWWRQGWVGGGGGDWGEGDRGEEGEAEYLADRSKGLRRWSGTEEFELILIDGDKGVAVVVGAGRVRKGDE